jgi:pyruvate dehydrogenase kinase 2/3/4
VRSSLREVIEFSSGRVTERKLIKSAQYVHSELLKRLAHRLVDIQTLPYIMVMNPSIAKVYDVYLEAFKKIEGLQTIKETKDEAAFTAVLTDIIDSTVNIVGNFFFFSLISILKIIFISCIGIDACFYIYIKKKFEFIL